MMLPGFEGERFYVNALTGWGINSPSEASPATSKAPSTTYSVHDRFYGGRQLARFAPPSRFGEYALRDAPRRSLAVTLAERLNAEEMAA